MSGNDVPLARAIRGPVTLITLGVLFALNNFTTYQFHQTWPVLLIVFGLLSLLRRTSESPPPPTQPPPAWPQPDAAPPGSFRQTSYSGGERTQPPAGGAV